MQWVDKPLLNQQVSQKNGWISPRAEPKSGVLCLFGELKLPHAAPVCFGGHKLVSQHEAVLLSIANAKDLSDGMHSQEEMLLYIFFLRWQCIGGVPPLVSQTNMDRVYQQDIISKKTMRHLITSPTHSWIVMVPYFICLDHIQTMVAWWSNMII